MGNVKLTCILAELGLWYLLFSGINAHIPRMNLNCPIILPVLFSMSRSGRASASKEEACFYFILNVKMKIN